MPRPIQPRDQRWLLAGSGVSWHGFCDLLREGSRARVGSGSPRASYRFLACPGACAASHPCPGEEQYGIAALTARTPRLLVAEADPELRCLFQQALEEIGYACTPASSLEAALRLLHQQPCDLVLTETFSRTGQDALEPLRPLLALSHPLPVILCTGWTLAEADVQREGFAALVTRPFDLEHLVTTVAEALHQPWTPTQRHQAEVVERYVAGLAQGGGRDDVGPVYGGGAALPLDGARLPLCAPSAGQGGGPRLLAGAAALLC